MAEYRRAGATTRRTRRDIFCMQNFIGIAGGDDLSRDRFIEKFRWRSILFSFFLFLVGCYCKLSSNERVYIYSYYRTNYIIRIYIFYEEKYTLSWFSLCFRTSRLVTSFSRVFSFAADTRQLFPPAQTRMGSLVQPHIF